MNKCVFCEIVAKKIDSELTVYEDESIIAQISLLQKPNNHGHVLVIPKEHHRDIYELPESLNAPLMSAIQRLSRLVKAAFSADGIQIRQNNEPAAGQDVFHLHFHVIPRFQNDDFEIEKYAELPLETRVLIANKLKLAVRGRA